MNTVVGTDASRAIDQRSPVRAHVLVVIGQIDRLQRARLVRTYNLCVLSDHGMTPSEPFQDVYGQTLGQYISSQLGTDVLLSEQAHGEQEAVQIVGRDPVDVEP